MKLKLLLPALAILAGCATDYCWTSKVPDDYRTVSVPAFRNESELNELGATMTRQMLREIQREGTFKVRRAGEAALEVQGVVKSNGSRTRAYDRRAGNRYNAYSLTASVEISVIDKRRGKVLVNNRIFTANADTIAGQDMTTAERDAAGRLADDLSRQVMDMMLALKYDVETEKSSTEGK